MKTGAIYNLIIERQKDWAQKAVIQSKASSSWETHTTELKGNLFQDLFPKSREEFEAGEGKELEKKMSVLWSSSALVVNVFDYWRKANRISEIAVACGAQHGMNDMTFERRYKIGRHGIAHLDVEFIGEHNNRFAIEAKFTEPYRCELNMDKYLAVDDYWQDIPKCKRLAEKIVSYEQEKPGYKYLDANQLIKHILGLSYRLNNPKNFTLLYLWYDYDSLEGQEHRKEIQKFSDVLKGEVDFRSMTYQRLYEEILSIPNVNQAYIDYLDKRYFQ
jgi:hypothetical protein